ncbi:MAG: hypothetical protein HYZ34_12235 [Ignavibacteriae bacterium]|nr:hypothetical protein [Ignavibacteriota bacterium]
MFKLNEINLKTVVYDRHARRRMKWRRNSEDDVRYVLEQTEHIEATIHGRINAFRTKDERYLKVTYKESEQNI